MCLAGDDLPIAVALQLGVSDVIPRFQILAEDRLGLVSVVTQYGGVADNSALGVLDLNRSGIPGRHRGDVGDQFRFVEKAAFLVGKDAVVGEIFFPRCLIAGSDGVVKLLGATDQFVLRNRSIRGMGKGNGGEKANEREFHKAEVRTTKFKILVLGLVKTDSPSWWLWFGRCNCAVLGENPWQVLAMHAATGL